MLQLESVTKHFATKTILKEASAHLRPGSRVGLVGPNGIGKTTLLRLILGEQTLDGGRIRKRPRLRIGYLPQDLEQYLGSTKVGAGGARVPVAPSNATGEGHQIGRASCRERG